MSGLILRLAWRELRHSLRFSAAFAGTLALGLAGFLTLESFKTSVDTATQSRSKALLAADLGVSARRELTPEELQTVLAEVGDKALQGRVMDFFTMVSNPQGTTSRLVQVKAIDATYPFYGELVRDRDTPDLTDRSTVWVAPELLMQLGLESGNRLKVGEAEFTISDIVRQDPSSAASLLSLAPKIYLHIDQLPATKLIQPGSSVSYTRLFKLAPETDTDALARRLNQKLVDPGIRVTTHKNASEQIARASKYLGDYLGLATLVGFFLASVGGAYLYRSFLSRRAKDIAVLRALGIQSGTAIASSLIQLLILGVLSLIPATLITLGLLPLIEQLMKAFLPFSLETRLSAASLRASLALATLGSTLICLPLIVRIGRLRTTLLFQETEVALPAFSWDWLWLGPAVVFYWGLSVLQCKSWVVGSIFMTCLLAASLFIMGCGALILRGLEHTKWKSMVWRIPIRQLTRQRVATLSCFLALSLGTLLVNLIAQLQLGIRHELQGPEAAKLPSFFLFDIQEDQLTGLLELLKNERATTNNVSPMIRARLLSVNDKDFNKDLTPGEAGTREQEVERRFRNRGFNLTYRDRLTDAEEIIEGRDISQEKGSTLVSVEKDFAKRLNLKIGDKMAFDIQGIPLEAQIANIRKIRWTNFQPNFFIQFAPGALDDAPKTFLASIANLSATDKLRIQNAMVSRFPNVSMVDVTDLVTRILSILVQMGWALEFMAYLSLIAGMIVLVAIAQQQARMRRWDTALLKTLGSRFEDVRNMTLVEFGTIAAVAALFGIVTASLMSFVLAKTVFDSAWIFDWRQPVASLLGVTAVSLAVTAIATTRALRQPPSLLLQGGKRDS